jgi:hypothetical protein
MKGWSLDQTRQQRADKRAEAARAAEAAGREIRGETFPLDAGSEHVDLGAEFPITVIGPLLELDEEIGLVVKQAFSLATAKDDAQTQREGVQLMMDLLVMNPNLPVKLVGIARSVAVNLLGEPFVAAFLGATPPPSPQDIGSLAAAIAWWYGEALGEAFGSSESSTDDSETSSQTSPGSTTGSTPDAPSSPEVTPPSSVSAA